MTQCARTHFPGILRCLCECQVASLQSYDTFWGRRPVSIQRSLLAWLLIVEDLDDLAVQTGDVEDVGDPDMVRGWNTRCRRYLDGVGEDEPEVCPKLHRVCGAQQMLAWDNALRQVDHPGLVAFQADDAIAK